VRMDAQIARAATGAPGSRPKADIAERSVGRCPESDRTVCWRTGNGEWGTGNGEWRDLKPIERRKGNEEADNCDGNRGDDERLLYRQGRVPDAPVGVADQVARGRSPSRKAVARGRART